MVFRYNGGVVKSLSEDVHHKCMIESPDVKAVSMEVDPEHPIVGFHGRTKDNDLIDLGVIWLDTTNPKCEKKLPIEVQ